MALATDFYSEDFLRLINATLGPAIAAGTTGVAADRPADPPPAPAAARG